LSSYLARRQSREAVAADETIEIIADSDSLDEQSSSRSLTAEWIPLTLADRDCPFVGATADDRWQLPPADGAGALQTDCAH